MIRLRILTPAQLERFLLFIGFSRTRQRGSHVFYKHPDGRATTIPHHKGRTIPRGLLRAILRDVGLELDDFNRLFDEL